MACEEESNECKSARSDYDQADFDKGTAEGRISDLTDQRNVAGGVAGTGIIVGLALFAIGPLGWAIGVGIVVTGVFTGGAIGKALIDSDKRSNAIKDCESARIRMFDAYNRATLHCHDSACVPPRGWESKCG